jgi:DNA polymerase V
MYNTQDFIFDCFLISFMQTLESFGGRVLIGEQIDFESDLLIPLVLSYVSAGFPSPADDYIESSIDLNRELIRHPFATFCVRASGDSMIDVGIRPNATLIVDRMIETKSGDIVIARIGDEMCVKELFIDEEGKVFLMPKNDNYKPIIIDENMDFEIWGKVVCSINRH